MGDRPSTDKPPLSQILAGERTDLAVERTRYAAERTLLAWVRTSLSLMTFGFTIYKFFQYLQESGAITGDWQPKGPRRLGLIMIGMGTVLLAVETYKYYALLKQLSRETKRRPPVTSALVSGVAISLLGLLAFLHVFFRTGHL